MRRLGLDEWAGLAMLVVAIVVAGPALLGYGSLTVPLWGWWLIFLGFAGAILVTLNYEENPRAANAGLAAAVLLSWVLTLTAARFGMMPILLVSVAAISAYVVRLQVSLAICLGNIVVIAAATALREATSLEIWVTAGLYLLIHVATVFSTTTMLRERRMRLEAAATQVELQAAAVLLEESTRTQERLRISRDLHDLIGHQLTVLTLELEAARHKQGAEAHEHVERANGVARELLSDVRATVGSMRAQASHLHEAIDRVVRDVPGLTVHTDVATDIDAGEAATTAVVRAVQEIVTNAMRHSGASTLSISVEQDLDGTVRLEAADDGRGSPDAAPGTELGNGLRGMIERFDAAGGTVQLDGSAGFQVRAQVPGR